MSKRNHPGVARPFRLGRKDQPWTVLKTWQRLCLVGLLGCVALSANAAEDPHRLSSIVRPVTQTLQLDLDPAADGYTGLARVELRFGISTNRFRFHAKDLELGRATLDGRELALEASEAGLVSATAANSIPAGLHLFEIAFKNDYNRNGIGLYKVVTGGKPYLFTQMEPMGARESFPCWDEPGVKIPWQITVTTPKDLEVLSNMPIAQTASMGANQKLEFGRTPPMPSYLVALVVGPLEFLPIEGQAVPGRVAMAPGQKPLAELAAKEAPPLLQALEACFGLPYPYPKLDHIAVPEFVFGAMENVGAITYRDALLLLDPANVSYEQRRGLTSIMAHEMAHMWFGNLVTMEWWDDLWLNESFATWISFNVSRQVHPDQRFELAAFQNVLRARAEDTQPSVRPIRRPFRGGDNVWEAFDALSYNKGHAILRMVEGWLGEERLRKALRQYFVRHQWANARAEDLWEAFAEASDPSILPVLRGYIEQPGIPVLTVTRLAGDRCQVRQQRYRTILATKVAEQTWHVPMVLRYGSGSAVKEIRYLLTKENEEFDVPGLDQATWVHPNAGESGYYTWNLAPDLASALANRGHIPLTATERLGLLNASGLALKTGMLPADQWLALLLTFTDDPAPEIRAQVVSNLISIHHDLVSAEDRPAFSRVIRDSLRPMLDSIGFAPEPGELPELSLLRDDLLRTLGIEGRDRDVVAFCREQALRLLTDPRSVNAGIADSVLLVTSWHGDRPWADQLQAALESAATPDLRLRLLRALTPFRDQTLARSAMDFLLTDKIRSTDIFFALRSAGHPDLAPVALSWIMDNYDRLKERLPEDLLPFLTHALDSADPTLLEPARDFFLDPARKTPLTETEFQKAADVVALRAALREKNSASLSAWLEQRRTARAEFGARALEWTVPPDWNAERWLNSPPLRLPDLQGKVVLVRWWTAGCPYCKASAPALRDFSDRYGRRGLVVLGMYHHKSPDPFDPQIYEDTARRYQFNFPLAFDPDWQNFKAWMRDKDGKTVDTGWTSVTFVLDKKGMVRHVHPGGQYVEGDPDHQQLTAVVEKLLAQD